MNDGLGITPALNTFVPANPRAPAIFYSPHQDDDAIGFAAAIAEHRAAGRPVFLVLISNGTNDQLRWTMNGVDDNNEIVKCDIAEYLDYFQPFWKKYPDLIMYTQWDQHEAIHNFGLSAQDIVDARTKEFKASALAMGVDQVFFINNGAGIDDATFGTGELENNTEKIKNVIHAFQLKFPNASHKFPSGYLDKDYNEKDAIWFTNITHQSVAEAALRAQTQFGLQDILFYRIYAYSTVSGNQQRHPVSLIQTVDDSWMTSKRGALAQYKVYDPAQGRYALGYHSVTRLIDCAMTDPKNYIDTADHVRAEIANPQYASIEPAPIKLDEEAATFNCDRP